MSANPPSALKYGNNPTTDQNPASKNQSEYKGRHWEVNTTPEKDVYGNPLEQGKPVNIEDRINQGKIDAVGKQGHQVLPFVEEDSPNCCKAVANLCRGWFGGKQKQD